MAETEINTVARPYARAAFSFALDQEGGLAIWSTMLAMMKACIESPMVTEALENPQLSTEQQSDLLVSLMGDDISAEGKNFVGLLAEYDRLGLLPAVSDMYEDLKANYEKTMEVDLVSAFEVSNEQQTELADSLKRKLQRDVNIHPSVDKSLIGGVVIRADDTVIDDSIRGRLGKMSQVLN